MADKQLDEGSQTFTIDVTRRSKGTLTISVTVGFLKTLAGGKPVDGRASKGVETASTFCEQAAKVWDELGLATKYKSIQHALVSYLQDDGVLDKSKPDPAEFAVTAFERQRRIAMESQMRFSADNADMIAYIPSAFFAGMSADEIKYVLDETAKEVPVIQLGFLTDAVARGSTRAPKAQTVASTCISALNTVLERLYGIREVDSWVDGPPPGYKPNAMQLRVLEARKLWPDSLEQNVHVKASQIVWSVFNPNKGPLRPKRIIYTTRLPPTNGETVEMLKQRRFDELQEAISEMTDDCITAISNATEGKLKRTYAFDLLGYPGSVLIDAWNSAYSTGESTVDLYTGFKEYELSVDRFSKRVKENGVYFPMDSQRMHTLSELTSRATRIPLVRPNTVRLSVYESHGHRSWLDALTRRVPRFIKRYRKSLGEWKRATATEAESKVAIDENYKHPNDDSDGSFVSEDDQKEVDNQRAKEELARGDEALKEVSAPPVIVTDWD